MDQPSLFDKFTPAEKENAAKGLHQLAKAACNAGVSVAFYKPLPTGTAVTRTQEHATHDIPTRAALRNHTIKPRPASVEERVALLMAQHPALWDEFCKYADAVWDAGGRHFGVAAVFERMRYQAKIERRGDYKLNNDLRAHFARLYIKKYPERAGFFSTRQTKKERAATA